VHKAAYTNYSFFAQDNWKVTNRLTMDLGLRYELPAPPIEKYGRYANFVPELGKLALASDKTLQGTGIAFDDPGKVATAAQLGLPASLVYMRYDDFAPRVGLAWRPFGGNNTVVRGGYGIFFGGALQNPVRNALASVFPFSLSQTFNRVAGNPSFLTLSNPFPSDPNLTGTLVNTVNGSELHAKTPAVQSWNLTIEREIGRKSAIEVSYVGSKGSHLGRQYNINQPYRSADTAPNFPVPFPGFGTMNYFGFNANSSYNAGMVIFRRRVTQGLFYRVSYTYGKSIDDASYLSGLHGDRGRSDWDIGHSFTTAFLWSAPWRKNVFVRGWEFAGSGRAYTGQPFTALVSNVNLNLGEANRPNRTAKGMIANPSADMWFNLAAFPVVPTGSFAFGNSGRSILDAPGSMQINLSVHKTFAWRERTRIQFRWEVFNALNHSNLGAPVNNVNQPNAGSITSAAPARLMQFGLRCSF